MTVPDTLRRSGPLIGPSGYSAPGPSSRLDSVGVNNTPIRRRYVDVPFGQMHVATTDPSTGAQKPPIVLLHQTPRSWDEYAEVLADLGTRRRLIVPDLPGMGASDPHPYGSTIEAFGAGVLAVLDALHVERFDLVGHHTGGVVAIELAAVVGPRVRRLVLSSTPYVDADGRARRQDGSHRVDDVALQPDGQHLVELWRGRHAFYPDGRPDLLARFVRDAVRAEAPAEGHRAVGSYEMERRLPDVAADAVLIVGHDADPYAFKELEPLEQALIAAGAPKPQTSVIRNGHVPLEFTAAAFVAAIEPFLGR